MNINESVFKTYDIRGKVGEELDEKLSYLVGRAFSDWLPNNGIVAVGRDMRPDSKQLSDSLIQGLIDQGRTVWDIGEVTSDMIYFAVGKYNLAGGAVVTASHNPGKYNGIKLYRDNVIAVGLESGLDKIKDLIISEKIKPKSKITGKIISKNITEDWVKHCLKFVHNLKPFNIAIDAGNGMAGAILPSILPHLPLKIKEMFFDLDGTFPNHEANPQKPENLKDLISEVVNNSLDFGVAFDGDGDRAGFVDDKGRPVLGSDLTTMVSKLYLDQYPGSHIIHEVRTSRATREFIKEWGGKPVKTKAGRVFIGSEMKRLNSPFGGETTGHLFFKENYSADSGLIAALLVIQAISDSGEKLSELVDKYRKYYMPPEINFEIEDKLAVLNRIKERFKDAETDETDGLSVDYPDWWFNIRISNTEPVIRLNIEGLNKKLVDSKLKILTDVINTK